MLIGPITYVGNCLRNKRIFNQRPHGASNSLSGNPLRSQNEAGFTLVELLVVLAILSLFAALAAPQVLKYLGGAKTGTARTQLSNIQSAIELYYLDIGSYPTSEVGLSALIKSPAEIPKWSGPYIKKKKALTDPWGRIYQYRLPGKYGDFDLFSHGRDGKIGGSGEDEDITSW